MRAALWMVGASLAGCLAATARADKATGVAIVFGMLGPLAVTCSTWVLAERTYRLHPERLTPLMVAAFAGKMVFFGAYVAIGLSVLSLRVVPFVVSFTSYFIVLYAIEALLLRRLFAAGA